MGKVQCVSIKNRSENWLMIERYLNNINTTFDKRVHDEYYNIKNKKLTELELTQIPFQKRLQRFVKWYKMSGELNTLRTGLDRHPRSPVKSNTYSPLKSFKIADDVPKLTLENNSENKQRPSVRSQIPSIDFDTNVQSISINSNISFNRVECNFRQFYFCNKNKFCKKVMKAPPDCFRWLAWIISSDVPEERNEELFLHYFKEDIEISIDNQIKKDLNRTFSEIYEINPNDTQNHLYRLLRAFSSIDKAVSYCQGMNFIAGFLLLISDFNEVDSFYMLINLFSETFTGKFGIRGFFTDDFPLLKAYIYVFDHCFQKFFPKLFTHFKELEIPDEVWIAKWFQTLYTICLPLNILVRFWDCLFSSGLDFLISFSLGLIQQLEKDLLKLEDSFDVIDFFKKMGPFFTSGSSKQHLNIEEIILNAKKFNITNSNIKDLINLYEKEQDTNVSSLKVKYDIGLSSISPSKRMDNYNICNSPDTTFKKLTTDYSTNGENLILLQDVEEEDLHDCDEYNIDQIDIKLTSYQLNYKQTPVKAIADES
jgi:hypothetical protein